MTTAANPPKIPQRVARRNPGQALVEYVLILALVVIALLGIVTAVGPALGNVFSNQVENLLGQTTTPYPTLNDATFWAYVTAVGNYTPIPITGIPGVGGGGVTATPRPSSIPGPTNTATMTYTPTRTVTAGPSPTFVDQDRGFPFSDTGNRGGDQSFWHAPFFNAVAAIEWKAEYWSGGGGYPNAPGGAATQTHDPLPASFPDISFFRFPPNAGGTLASGNFYAKFTNKDTINKVRFEGRAYEIAVVAGLGDGVRVQIGNQTVINIDPNTQVAPYLLQRQRNTFAFTPDPVTGFSYQDIVVEYWGGADAEAQMSIVISTVADERPDANSFLCGWTTQGTYKYTPPNAWQDRAANYAIETVCNLRLRGWIDIPAGATDSRFTFWDQWTIGPNTTAQVGIREYLWNGTNTPWEWLTVHPENSANAGFVRQSFLLSNFNGKDFRGKKIELAFRVNASNTDRGRPAAENTPTDGWYIDNIEIAPNVILDIEIPAKDDFDSASTNDLAWLPECGWAVTAGQGRQFSGMSDSPSGNYAPNTTCSLYMGKKNGAVIQEAVLDLTSYGGANPADPELDFNTKYTLNGTTTEFVVEVANIDDRTNWQPLTPRAFAQAKIASGTATSNWTPVNISLLSLANSAVPNKKWFVRFRLTTDGATPADGVVLDDIDFRERPSAVVGLPFVDKFGSGTNWTLSGSWGLTTSIRHSSPNSLTDSPSGNYVNGDTTATLFPQISLDGAVAPKIEFWTRWETVANATLSLEAGTIEDDTVGVYPDVLWSHTTGSYDDINRAWKRIRIDLTDPSKPWASKYLGVKRLQLRFRMQVTSGSADGWHIDDLKVSDDTFPAIPANPFYDNIESQAEQVDITSTQNWHAGGDWKLSTGDKRSGSRSWYTSPLGGYPTPGDSILETIYPLDLNGVAQPVLSFWTKHEINTNHFLVAEVQIAGNSVWTRMDWQGASVNDFKDGLNLGWTRNLVVLDAFANQKILVRFRLEAFNPPISGTSMVGGWYLDDVYVGPRNQVGLTTPYSDTFTPNGGATEIPTMTLEGDWQAVSGTGPWRYELPTGLAAVNYNYGGGNNNLWNVDYYHFSQGVAPNAYPVTNVCPAGATNQISDLILGTGTTVAYNGSGPTTRFGWTGGSPNPSVTNTDNLIYMDVVNEYVTVRLPADQNTRRATLWLGSYNAATELRIGIDDVSVPAFSVISGGTTTTTLENRITIDYNASTSGKTLSIELRVTAIGASPRAMLRAVTLHHSGALGTPSGIINLVENTTTTGTVVLSTYTPASGTWTAVDWTHYGYNSSQIVNRRGDCAKAIRYQSTDAVNYKWDAANVPANAAGLADWRTTALDYENFMVVMTRIVNVSSGNYLFWLAGDDGMKLCIDDVAAVPCTTEILPSTTLAYPFKSASANGYTNASFNHFFYPAILSAGQKRITVVYFQNTGEAYLRLQMASDRSTSPYTAGIVQNTVLHNDGGAGTTLYALKSQTGAYYGARGWSSSAISPPDGGIRIPAGKQVKITYYTRYINRSGATTLQVYISKTAPGVGTGTVWTSVTPQRQARSINGKDIYATLENVTFSANINDESTSVSPGYTHQNWNLHEIIISNPEAVDYLLNIKFEIDARAETTAADGWYIDDLQVTPF